MVSYFGANLGSLKNYFWQPAIRVQKQFLNFYSVGEMTYIEQFSLEDLLNGKIYFVDI